MGIDNASALRKGRFSEEGRIYQVTFVTAGRSPWFNSFELGRIVVSVMKNESQFAEALAFVVMPDHVHCLVQLDKKPLNQTVHDVKPISAHRINRMLGRSGRFWQDGFHHHAVRQYEDVVDQTRNVVMKPIRGGLVKSIRDYPMWDAVWI